MKTIRFIISTFVMLLLSYMVLPNASKAQCAMCSLNAENSTKGENTQGKGLNSGILFLLSMPFLIGAGIGVLWYVKFRHKETKSSVL
ncbi:hypothetical protein G5B35_17980 [Parapusillimonas sp. SGNA-6]|uniref:hypothetical protein n=1 Tax=Parapedobacter sp. SGR-10 TaxID=2710879 RepID=UPI0013D352CE|nr:hypothetical protein [Parapedobacter sp. SGR-10]NGF54937.1 hypothetical protein [Parapedobacter sp. SGR-10]NGM89185.1 hypothetical protein [Parapusillimonas sp. SGNA-6]